MASRSASICLTCVVTWVLIYLWPLRDSPSALPGLWALRPLREPPSAPWGRSRRWWRRPAGGAARWCWPGTSGCSCSTPRPQITSSWYNLGTIIFCLFDVSFKGNIDLVCNCFFLIISIIQKKRLAIPNIFKTVVLRQQERKNKNWKIQAIEMKIIR